jgi:hypothetical protein
VTIQLCPWHHPESDDSNPAAFTRCDACDAQADVGWEYREALDNFRESA